MQSKKQNVKYIIGDGKFIFIFTIIILHVFL